MSYWLLKTEPGNYAFSDLQRAGRAVWDGVKNNWALQHIRSMAPGDRVFIYHTGKEKAIAGIAEVASEPYPDPASGDLRHTVVDVIPVHKFSGRITLDKIKSDPFFRDFMLVKFSRLSVMPVNQRIWHKILKMEGLESV